MKTYPPTQSSGKFSKDFAFVLKATFFLLKFLGEDTMAASISSQLVNIYLSESNRNILPYLPKQLLKDAIGEH